MTTSSPRPWLWLYRPAVPSVRAQAIQVVHSAHAMALRGHDVTLLVEPTVSPWDPKDALAFYGLEPIRGLKLRTLPVSGTAASLAFRAHVVSWLARNGRRGIVYARSKRYAAALPPGATLIVEAHEVDSLQDPANAAAHRALEESVFRRARGVVANCPGTRTLLQETYPWLPASVACHNATHPSRARRPTDPGEGVGYVGSVRTYKDLDTLARAAARVAVPVTVVGAEPSAETDALVALSSGRLRIEAPIPHGAVPDRLARFRTLVIPLSDTLFGQSLTSPLKLWDALAVGRPIVAADLSTIRDAAPGAFVAYRPGDADDLAAAIERAEVDESLRSAVLLASYTRTWAQRAAEIEGFVESVIG